MADIVASKLQLQWSPEQIAGWLKRIYEGIEDYQVSHETIYRSLHPSTRRLEKGIVGALATYPENASFAPSHPENR
jgi:IS30 family transposase